MLGKFYAASAFLARTIFGALFFGREKEESSLDCAFRVLVFECLAFFRVFDCDEEGERFAGLFFSLGASLSETNDDFNPSSMFGGAISTGFFGIFLTLSWTLAMCFSDSICSKMVPCISAFLMLGP